jgi:peptidylprolyl isomerase
MHRLILATVLLLGACRAKAGGQVAGSPESVSYARELGVDLSSMEKRPSGLYVKDVAVGNGAVAAPGSTVDVHYTGWLVDGKQFDSSRGGEPLSFAIGQGMVITGWDEGITGMKVGGKRLLVIPPALGYGEAGAGVIPPGATLVFEVELLGVR